ncbi:MAG: hypothetical protein HQK60_08360 [Deltaproteobacteria bacterium]|nr:hypothetical protein [Deltaproteobacteria bacterium]
MKKEFAFFPALLIMCLMLNLLVLAAGSSQAEAAAIATPGVWRNPDGAAIILQTYSNNSAIGIYTPDGKNIRAFYTDKIVSGEFDGGDIPTQGKTFRLRIEFDLQTALVHLINATTGEEQLDVFSLDELALPNQDSDGIWQDALDPSQYFLFQRYQNGGAMLLSIGSNQVAEMYYNPLAEMNKFSGWDVYNPHVAKTEFTFTSSTQGTIVRTGVDGSTKTWQVTKFGATKTVKFWGWVLLDKPVSGATVSICDTKNGIIYGNIAVTASNGAYYVENKYLPDEFRIVVTGGTYNGQPFSGKIIREVHSFDSEYFYKVNDITTLLAAYRDRHPEKTYAQAQQVITSFLKVPGAFTIDEVIDFCDYYKQVYDPDEFVQAMIKQMGGVKFNEFIDLLVDEIDEGAYYPFRSTSRGAIGVIIGKIIGGIFEGLELVGQIFDIMDQQGQAAKIDAILQQLDEVQGQLKQISASLDQMRQRIDTAVWIGVIQRVQNAKDRIETDYNTLRKYVIVYKTPGSEAGRKKWLADNTASIIKDYPLLLTAIHNTVVGALGVQPALSEWGQLCSSSLKAGKDARYQDIQDMFSQLSLLQAQGLQLLCNAFKHDNNVAMRDATIQEYKNDRQPKQITKFMTPVENFVFSHFSEDYYNSQFNCAQNENNDLALADKYLNEISSTKNVFTATVMQLKKEDVPVPGLSGGVSLALSSSTSGHLIDCGKGTFREIQGLSPWGQNCTWQVLRYKTTGVPADDYILKVDFRNFNPIVFNFQIGYKFQTGIPGIKISGDNSLGSFSAYTVPWRTVKFQCWSGRKYLVVDPGTPGDKEKWIGAQWDEPNGTTLNWYEVRPSHAVLGYTSGDLKNYFLRLKPGPVEHGQCLIFCPKAYDTVLDLGQYDGSGQMVKDYLWQSTYFKDSNIFKFQMSGFEFGSGQRFLTMNATSSKSKDEFYRMLLVSDTGVCCLIPTGDLASWLIESVTPWQ